MSLCAVLRCCRRRTVRPCSHGIPNASVFQMLGLVVVYVVTGAAQPILTDWIKYRGGTGSSSSSVTLPLLLPMVANTAGMASVGLLMLRPWCVGPPRPLHAPSPSADGMKKPPRRGLCTSGQVFLLVWVDMAASVLILLGLLLVGSGVYVVMYSSTTLWTAAIASLAKAQSLSSWQWAGVLCLTSGLVINGHEQLTRDQSGAGHNLDGGAVNVTVPATATTLHGSPSVAGSLMGSALIVVGSLLHATFFVLADRLLQPPPPPPPTHTQVDSATWWSGTDEGGGQPQPPPLSPVQLSGASPCAALALVIIMRQRRGWLLRRAGRRRRRRRCRRRCRRRRRRNEGWVTKIVHTTTANERLASRCQNCRLGRK